MPCEPSPAAMPCSFKHHAHGLVLVVAITTGKAGAKGVKCCSCISSCLYLLLLWFYIALAVFYEDVPCLVAVEWSIIEAAVDGHLNVAIARRE